jgi:hypothetical protein
MGKVTENAEKGKEIFCAIDLVPPQFELDGPAVRLFLA